MNIAEKLTDVLPQEKVYLTFNKPQYVSGEDMYFKAFVVMANNHNVDSISSVLYVDVLNVQTGALIDRKT